ncbi:glycosyltransferase [Photobacterium carnosum]|uniref:glycosyltransferase n=1 Tax=Photobacterium carnosum TaxID=2023717 RepID=UPI001E5F1BB5|nr:glycosyltransferase [Photobacterium carnosum]MCD9526026.1 glycosyltransferase [Photobacterium carnosum]
MENKELPLVTLVVIAYNQEKYIREAIEGAFAQTYSPLEIILSDDNSPDSTFAIMEEMASNYTGPHKIIVNRNNPNRGIGGHINRMMELSSGELIFISAGDDISLSNRVEKITEIWMEDKSRKLIFSNSELIDENSKHVENYFYNGDLTEQSLYDIIKNNSCCSGATAVIDRDIFNEFGYLNSDICFEDRAWATRAKLIGKIYHTKDILIKYRCVGGISRKEMKRIDWFTKKALFWYENFISDYKQKKTDLQCCFIKDNELENIINNKISVFSFKRDIIINKCTMEKIFNSKLDYRDKLKLFAFCFVNRVI